MKKYKYELGRWDQEVCYFFDKYQEVSCDGTSKVWLFWVHLEDMDLHIDGI